jgi:quinohemoprotein amine dehydrogenase
MGALGILLALANPLYAQGEPDAGIPVGDPLVRSKCATCHAVDERGNMQRVSSARATPEGWQDTLRRMIRENDVEVTPEEARDIVRYLSTNHGLAPDETRPLMYYPERRIHDESAVAAAVRDNCSRCHQAARALVWRRSAADWKLFAERHAARYRFELEPDAVEALMRAAPFRTPEWDVWRTGRRATEVTGRWLVSAHIGGRGSFAGEMEVEAAAGSDELQTRVRLRAVGGRSIVNRTGRAVVYAGHAWRGRSSGAAAANNGAPDDLSNETRDVMWVAPDGSTAEGRWFWGEYQELGFDVRLRRASSGPALLLVDPVALKVGSTANRLRLIGDGFPGRVTTRDVVVGPGMTVRRIVSSGPTEIVAEVDVAKDSVPGGRDIAFRSSRVARAVALYDRVDYVRVIPDSATATFGNTLHPRGFQQFEALRYHRGPDGRRYTSDDLELGPADVTWSMELFYEVDQSRQDRVGTLGPTGFFSPAAVDPAANFDVWVIATAKEMGQDGRPLVGKGYLVVTVPTYSLGGRTFVRDLDRWVEEGSGR